jgi:uncharacterized membrane protein YgcG
MPGVIVIERKTDEWDIDEYNHDLFDRLLAKGLLDKSGFLLYISIEDRKMSLVLGYDLERVTDRETSREIRNELGAALGREEYFKGITDAVARLRQLTGPVELDEARRQRGEYLMLAGFVILISVLIMNIAKKRRRMKQES